MSKPKLTYFDFPGRGEDCRLAFFVAGVEFEDDRLARGAWQDLKPKTPWGSLPVLQIAGKGELAQSNAILRYIGDTHGLLPRDPFEAARHCAVMDSVEDVRWALEPSMRTKDPAEKKALREAFADGYLQRWASNVERQIGAGPFLGGDEMSVADLKVHSVVKWLTGGVVDHIPPSALASHAKLLALCEAVKHHPRVRAYYAR